MSETHAGIAGGHYAGKAMVHKILQAGLWWLTMHANTQDYCHSCDVFQRIGKPSKRDEIPLVPQLTSQEFDKWVVEFVGPISLARKRIGSRYILTMTDYLTGWAENAHVKDCTSMMATNFLFENVVTRFGCPNILISDQGMHFFNELIEDLTDEFHIQHRRKTPYHPQANGAFE